MVSKVNYGGSYYFKLELTNMIRRIRAVLTGEHDAYLTDLRTKFSKIHFREVANFFESVIHFNFDEFLIEKLIREKKYSKQIADLAMIILGDMIYSFRKHQTIMYDDRSKAYDEAVETVKKIGLMINDTFNDYVKWSLSVSKIREGLKKSS